MWRNFSLQINSNRWPNLTVRSSGHILNTAREINWGLIRRLDFHCACAGVADEGYSKLLLRCQQKSQKKVNRRCLFGTAEVFVWARWHGLRTVGSTIMLTWAAEAWRVLYVGLPYIEIWRLAPQIWHLAPREELSPHVKSHRMMWGTLCANHAMICTCLWSQFW